MKKVFIVFFVMVYCSRLVADEAVVLFSPLSKVSNPFYNDSLRYSKYYMDRHPHHKNVDLLLADFENAQKYYLVKSYALARQYFEKVVGMADMDEWNALQRQIVFVSYIRLAELNADQSSILFEQALAFAPEINLSELGFSKATIKELERLKTKQRNDEITWDTTSFRDDFHFIVINGHAVDLRKKRFIKIPTGKYRITFLSDTYKAQTMMVTSQQIPLMTPIRIPFVSGNCERPALHNEGDLPASVTVVYPDNCVRKFSENKWDNDSLKKIDQQPIAYHAQTSTTAPDSWAKRNWIWVTLGVVLTGVLISAQSTGNKKPTHETVNGF